MDCLAAAASVETPRKDTGQRIKEWMSAGLKGKRRRRFALAVGRKDLGEPREPRVLRDAALVTLSHQSPLSTAFHPPAANHDGLNIFTWEYLTSWLQITLQPCGHWAWASERADGRRERARIRRGTLRKSVPWDEIRPRRSRLIFLFPFPSFLSLASIPMIRVQCGSF